ncbi:O-antigen ligase family protein, partial [Candidatus Bipolaricaulota bacterium]|nr:O-antigen ligase family protein [Candidatus Bipolaricaulota bacterium]
FLFIVIVANVVKEKRDVNLILCSLVLSAFFVSLYGLLQYLGVMRGAFGGRGLSEIISTMGNRNYLGGFLSYLFFPAAILVGRLRRLWSRALAVAGVGFVLAMVLFLQQTGTQLGLVVGALFLLVGLGLWPQVSYLRRAWPWWAGIGGICLAAVGIVLGPSTLGIGLLLFIILGAGSYGLGWAFRRWRWTWVPILGVGLVMLFLLIPSTTPFTAVERTWEQNSGRVRSWDWWVGWEMFKDHPVVGVGLGNYKLNFIPYKAKFLASPQGAGYNFHIARAAQAHNEYVQVTAELGSLGILALLALLITAPICFWIRLHRNLNEGDRFDLLLFSCGVVAFLVHALVSFPAHLPASCLVLVLVLGLASSRAYGE